MCKKTNINTNTEENVSDQSCDYAMLKPSFSSDQRCSPIVVGIFNLVATIVGGGLLSVPLAFEKCGVVLATFSMVFSAFATDRSLYLLCLCSQYTGATSFGEVAKMALGPWMECLVSLLLFIFLLFVLVAFMVLVRDIWTPVLNALFKSELNDDIVLLIILILMSPFLTRRTLYALRYNCYIGFASATILCAGICHRTWLDGTKNIKLYPESMGDALYGFPIITLSFLSCYNILPVYSSLTQPTNARIGGVINGAIGSSLVITYVFGLIGYLYFGSSVKGNILTNFDQLDDWAVLIGRFGYGTSLMLALAIFTLPCRDNILEVLDRLRGLENNCDEAIEETICDTSILEEGTYLLQQSGKQPKTIMPLAKNQFIHYGSTFLITAACYVGAVAVPGVDVVWSLCGSCMAFLLSFILPAIFYLRIQSQQEYDRSTDFIGSTRISYSTLSRFFLYFSVVGAITCTIQSTILCL